MKRLLIILLFPLFFVINAKGSGLEIFPPKNYRGYSNSVGNNCMLLTDESAYILSLHTSIADKTLKPFVSIDIYDKKTFAHKGSLAVDSSRMNLNDARVSDLNMHSDGTLAFILTQDSEMRSSIVLLNRGEKGQSIIELKNSNGARVSALAAMTDMHNNMFVLGGTETSISIMKYDADGKRKIDKVIRRLKENEGCFLSGIHLAGPESLLVSLNIQSNGERKSVLELYSSDLNRLASADLNGMLLGCTVSNDAIAFILNKSQDFNKPDSAALVFDSSLRKKSEVRQSETFKKMRLPAAMIANENVFYAITNGITVVSFDEKKIITTQKYNPNGSLGLFSSAKIDDARIILLSPLLVQTDACRTSFEDFYIFTLKVPHNN